MRKKTEENTLKAHADQDNIDSAKKGTLSVEKWKSSSSSMNEREFSDSNLMSAKFGGIMTKEAEMEHYDFLNQLKIKWNVDSEKLINLEARITCKYFEYLI